MATSPHTLYINDETWRCISDYARWKGVSVVSIYEKLGYDFLSTKEVKDFINEQIEKKKKIMSKRNII